MYDSANYMQTCRKLCFRVTYLTPPRQAGLGSWFRSLPLGVPGPFALATGSLQCQWDGLRLPVLARGPGPPGLGPGTGH